MLTSLKTLAATCHAASLRSATLVSTARSRSGVRRSSTTAPACKMLQANRLRQALTRGGPTMGVWQMLPGANISRMLARTPGVDWVMVDCEHGLMDGGLTWLTPPLLWC